MPPIKYKNRVANTEDQPEEVNIIAESRVSSGMNSYLDPADIPNGMLALAQNAEIRGDRTYRTPGASNITPAAPNTNKILLYTSWKRFSDITEYLRFTRNSVHRKGAGWTALTGTLTGTDSDRFRWTVISDATRDYFIFTNGIDVIKEINTAVSAYANLGAAAPAAKYICGFFNRVVAANITTPGSVNPILLKWSGDLNFDEWNPSVDISAGSNPLVEAQADYSDNITGLFSFAAVMLILRERSLWLATKRPVASNPFAFQAAFPSVGCDTPNSATQTRNGICWYDGRANQVYYYEVGSSPTPVGDPIRDLLRANIRDVDLVQGSYDVTNNTYILTCPSDTSVETRIFKLNLDNGAWTFDTKNDVSGTFFLDSGTSGIRINDLVGFIDGLRGTINSLQGIASVPTITYGMYDGDIEEQGNIAQGGALRLESKIFRGNTDTYISRLALTIMPIYPGSAEIQYKRNGGIWTLYKTVTFATPGTRQHIYCVKTLLCHEYQWAFNVSSGDAAVLHFKIEAVSAPEDK